MQVVTASETGLARAADLLALGDVLSLRDARAAEVCVQRRQTESVVDHHGVAVDLDRLVDLNSGNGTGLR